MLSTPESDFTTDPGISWSQLRAFQACLTLRSFGSAASALNLTPAAVRHQVALLERRFGGPLFVRHSGRLTPNAIGAAFGREIDRPMRALVAACAGAAGATRAQEIELTAPPLFARRFLMGRAFLKWCGDNQVRLDVTDTKRGLAPQVVAVRLAGEPEGDFAAVPLVQVQLRLAASSAIARGARVDDAAWWRDQTLLSPAMAAGAWDTLWRKLGHSGARPREVRYTSYAAAIDAARDGLGLVLAPTLLVDADVTAGRIAFISDLRHAAPQTYNLLISAAILETPRGRALRRRIVNAVDVVLEPDPAGRA